jgi:general stress protein YciG
MAQNNKRGFAAMDSEQQHEIARKGGQASGASGAAGKTQAAKRGGQNSPRNR